MFFYRDLCGGRDVNEPRHRAPPATSRPRRSSHRDHQMMKKPLLAQPSRHDKVIESRPYTQIGKKVTFLVFVSVLQVGQRCVSGLCWKCEYRGARFSVSTGPEY